MSLKVTLVGESKQRDYLSEGHDKTCLRIPRPAAAPVPERPVLRPRLAGWIHLIGFAELDLMCTFVLSDILGFLICSVRKPGLVLADL